MNRVDQVITELERRNKYNKLAPHMKCVINQAFEINAEFDRDLKVYKKPWYKCIFTWGYALCGLFILSLIFL